MQEHWRILYLDGIHSVKVVQAEVVFCTQETWLPERKVDASTIWGEEEKCRQNLSSCTSV